MLLVAAAALDITGRIGQIGPARFTAYQLLAAALALGAGWLLARRRATLPRTPLTLPAAAFLALAAVSVLFAAERGRAMVQLVSLTSCVLLTMLVVVLVRRSADAVRVVLGVLGVATLWGALAVAEWADVFAVRHPVLFTPGYGIRARVTFDDPNILASFLMTALLLALPLLLFAPLARRTRALGLAASAVVLTGLVTTFSRGALGGLVLGLLCIFALARMPRRARLALAVAAVALLLLAGALVFSPTWFAENVLDLGSNASAMNRVYMAEGALRMWADHPLGVGLDNYQVFYPRYRDPRADAGIVESHLAYLTILAEMGFLGLLAFVWLLAAYFVRATLPVARRAADPTLRALAVGAFAAGVGLAAQAFTYSIEGSKFLWFTLGVGTAVWSLYSAGPQGPAAQARSAR